MEQRIYKPIGKSWMFYVKKCFFWEFILDSSLLTQYTLYIQPHWIFLRIVLTENIQLLCFIIFVVSQYL